MINTYNYKLTEQNKEIILNQIDLIHLNFNINQSILIDLILYQFLTDNNLYGLISKTIDCIITDIAINRPHLITEKLNELENKKILIKTRENDIDYYSLNRKELYEKEIY